MEVILSILVAALSMLTMILLGNTFINALFVNKRIKSIISEHLRTEMRKIDEKINKLQRATNLNTFMILCNSGKYDKAIYALLSTLTKSTSEEVDNIYLPHALGILKDCDVRLGAYQKEMCKSMADVVTSQGKDITELKKIIDNS